MSSITGFAAATEEFSKTSAPGKWRFLGPPNPLWLPGCFRLWRRLRLRQALQTGPMLRFAQHFPRSSGRHHPPHGL